MKCFQTHFTRPAFPWYQNQIDAWKKRKTQTSISGKNRCKNSQQNIDKPNLAADWKDYSFPGGSDGNESAWNAGSLGLIPGLGKSLGEENSNPLQYSCLENSMDRGACQATVHGVAKSQTWLSNEQFHIAPTMCHALFQASGQKGHSNKPILPSSLSSIHCSIHPYINTYSANFQALFSKCNIY